MKIRRKGVKMIFCVEDDNGIRNMVLYTLGVSGFEVMGFSDGTALFEALAEKTPELIMLDIMLPGEDGISILRRLRSQTATADIPIIMATAKGTEYDKVIGLDMGADDYLAKPFGMMEMVSRVKAVLRRAGRKSPENNRQLRTGELELDLDQHTVSAAGKRIQLTFKEFELLCLFMQNVGRVFTREQLLSSVWGVDFMGETRTVDVHIGTLREKLGACSDYIETVRGVGYRIKKII